MSHPDGRLAVDRRLEREAIREMMTRQSAGIQLMTRQRQANRAGTKASVMTMTLTQVPVSRNNDRTRYRMP
jgi:hypothetical protein